MNASRKKQNAHVTLSEVEGSSKHTVFLGDGSTPRTMTVRAFFNELAINPTQAIGLHLVCKA